MSDEVVLPSDSSMTTLPSEKSDAVSTVDAQDPLLRTLLYGLSLPERVVRSAVGLSAGTAKEIAELIVPQAFQNSKSYEIAVRNSLGFLVSGLGTISAPTPSVAPSPQEQEADLDMVSVEQSAPIDVDAGRVLARKAAGSFIDLAGLATLHLSPIWVLAIVSDVAYGSQGYLQELNAELLKQGLIDSNSTIHRVEDLFDAIKNASGKAASQFDQPPLSVDELRSSVDQLRQSLGEIDPRDVIPEAELRRYWAEMQTLANQEHVSLIGLSGAVAMRTVETIKDVTHGTMSGLFVAGKILNRDIFQHYTRALDQIGQQGLWSTVSGTYEPYIELAWGNFTSAKKSWTEQLLDPRHLSGAWNRVKQWFNSSDVGSTPAQSVSPSSNEPPAPPIPEDGHAQPSTMAGAD